MPDPLTPYMNLLRPFSPLVWTTVIVSLLLIMSFYSAYAAREAQESGLAHCLWYSLRDVFGSFLGQGKIIAKVNCCYTFKQKYLNKGTQFFGLNKWSPCMAVIVWLLCLNLIQVEIDSKIFCLKFSW